jgi:hypothetical protein
VPLSSSETMSKPNMIAAQISQSQTRLVSALAVRSNGKAGLDIGYRKAVHEAAGAAVKSGPAFLQTCCPAGAGDWYLRLAQEVVVDDVKRGG